MTFHKVSVLIPTRLRPARLRTLLASYEATAIPPYSELVFRVDYDDTESQILLAKTRWSVFTGPKLDGYRSMPQYLMDALSMATGDVLMIGNDDMIFESSAWDTAILAEANKYPDGLFNIGVQTHNADHYPFSTVSRKAVEALGFVYDPRLFWGDIFLRDVMRFAGRCVLLPDVYVTHDWVGHNPDAVFQESAHLKVTVGDAQYWANHSKYVDEAVAKLSVEAIA